MRKIIVLLALMFLFSSVQAVTEQIIDYGVEDVAAGNRYMTRDLVGNLYAVYAISIPDFAHIIYRNHGAISKTVPWLKSVTFIEP